MGYLYPVKIRVHRISGFSIRTVPSAWERQINFGPKNHLEWVIILCLA